MSQLLKEELVPLPHAALYFPEVARPSPSTLHRYAFKGHAGTLLETVIICSRRFTSRQAVERFVCGKGPKATKEELKKVAATRIERGFLSHSNK